MCKPLDFHVPRYVSKVAYLHYCGYLTRVDPWVNIYHPCMLAPSSVGTHTSESDIPTLNNKSDWTRLENNNCNDGCDGATSWRVSH